MHTWLQTQLLSNVAAARQTHVHRRDLDDNFLDLNEARALFELGEGAGSREGGKEGRQGSEGAREGRERGPPRCD